MSRSVSVGVGIHGAPKHASTMATVGAPLVLSFGNPNGYPEVTMYCGSAALASALAAAINGVLAQHKPAEEAA